MNIRLSKQLWDALMDLTACFIRLYGTTDIKDFILFDLTNRSKLLFYKQNRIIDQNGEIVLSYEESQTAKEILKFFSDNRVSLPVDEAAVKLLYRVFE